MENANDAEVWRLLLEYTLWGRDMTLTKQLEHIQLQLKQAQDRAEFFNYSVVTIERIKLAWRLITKIQEQVAIDLKESHVEIESKESSEEIETIGTAKEMVRKKAKEV